MAELETQVIAFTITVLAVVAGLYLFYVLDLDKSIVKTKQKKTA